MKSVLDAEITIPDSSRVVVERAVALSKELDSRWQDEDETLTERPGRAPDKVIDEHPAFCRKNRR